VFGLLWLIVAATIIWGQNATTAACALFIQQTEGTTKTDLRSIVAGVRRRRRDLARAAFRIIVPPLIHEGLGAEEARRRWAALTTPIRRQASYALFRRVLAFALGLTVSQQILTASAFLLDLGLIYFNITRDVFFHDMSNSIFFWLPTALMIGIAAFSLSMKSAIEQSVIYLAARKALGELSLEQRALLPDPETWRARRWASWKTYAPACAIIVSIIGFHLSKFPWMIEQVKEANLYSVKALHASGVPVPRRLGQPEFEIPVFIRSTKLTQYLIEKGMDVNASFKLGNNVGWPFRGSGGDVTLSPLMAALSFHMIDVARLLIEHGADARARDSLGRTTMATAASNCPEAIELLLASGEDINEQTRLGTPLLIAARYQWPYSEPALLDFASSQDEPPLNRQSDAIKILIEKGADPNSRDGAGRNALMVMSMEPWAGEDLETALDGRKKIAPRLPMRRRDKIVESIGETLLNAGCDVNAADNKGRAPPMYAAASGRLAVVELLLKRGANIRATDHNGESALDWAMKSGDDKLIRRLSLISSFGAKKLLRPRLEVFDPGVLPPLSFPGGKKTSR
jgi:ankyrin repeat protein